MIDGLKGEYDKETKFIRGNPQVARKTLVVGGEVCTNRPRDFLGIKRERPEGYFLHWVLCNCPVGSCLSLPDSGGSKEEVFDPKRTKERWPPEATENKRAE